jgi:hypothetical protein
LSNCARRCQDSRIGVAFAADKESGRTIKQRLRKADKSAPLADLYNRYADITAEQARKLAISTPGKTLKGDDPAEERATRRNALTVKELSERYLAAADKGLILGREIDRRRRAPCTSIADALIGTSCRCLAASECPI